MSIMIPNRLGLHAIAWSGCLLLGGCLGGGGEDTVPVEPVTLGPLLAVPATATQSITGLFQYQATINSSTAADQDKAEPLDISALVLPTSETAEPTEV